MLLRYVHHYVSLGYLPHSEADSSTFFVKFRWPICCLREASTRRRRARYPNQLVIAQPSRAIAKLEPGFDGEHFADLPICQYESSQGRWIDNFSQPDRYASPRPITARSWNILERVA